MRTFSYLLTLGSFLVVGCATDGTDDIDEIDPIKELARQADGLDEDGADLCAENGWYDDGVCDDFCPEADPDCAVADDGCQKTGCSGHVCSDEEVYTTCEWHESYACYADAICERQSDGSCGFTMTDDLEACLAGS